MKRTIVSLMLGLALSAGAAHGAGSVTATNLGIATLDTMLPLDMKVVSDTGDTLSVSMDGFLTPEKVSVKAGYEGIAENHLYNFSALQFDVRAGYRITSLTFSGIATGTLDVTPPPPGTNPDPYPFAGNYFDISWGIQGGSGYHRAAGDDFAGTQAFSITTGQSIEGRSVLEFTNTVSATALGYQALVCTDHCWDQLYDTSASLQVSNLVMTVQIAAVPEPETYGMLLGGLAVIAAAMRTGLSARRDKGV